MGVHIAANNGMPQCLHVDTELMRTPCNRFEFNQCAVISPLNDLEISQSVFAALVADDLFWPIWPVCCYRQFYRAGVLRQLAPQDSRVFFFDLTTLKLSGKL